jgi:hypothetical protein
LVSIGASSRIHWAHFDHFWIWASDFGLQADALGAPAAAAKIGQPTAVRTFFAGREE